MVLNWILNSDDKIINLQYLNLTELLLEEGLDVIQTVGEALLKIKYILFGSSSLKMRKHRMKFLSISSLLLDRYPEHYCYFSSIFFNDYNLISYFTSQFKKINVLHFKKNQQFNLILEFLAQIIQRKNSYHQLLHYFASLIDVKQSDIIDSNERIFGLIMKD